MQFNDVEQISATLTKFGVDTQQYGKGSAKTLDQLLKEIKEGESSLSVSMRGELTRTITVLLISIKRADGKILTEVNQKFHATKSRDEYTRQRNCVLAEKLKFGEDVKLAIGRALNEELGIDTGKFVLDYVVPCVVEKRTSQSYPGLNCEYYTLKVTIPAEDLKEIPDNYQYTEYFENGSPRVTATWSWI